MPYPEGCHRGILGLVVLLGMTSLFGSVAGCRGPTVILDEVLPYGLPRAATDARQWAWQLPNGESGAEQLEAEPEPEPEQDGARDWRDVRIWYVTDREPVWWHRGGGHRKFAHAFGTDRLSGITWGIAKLRVRDRFEPLDDEPLYEPDAAVAIVKHPPVDDSGEREADDGAVAQMAGSRNFAPLPYADHLAFGEALRSSARDLAERQAEPVHFLIYVPGYRTTFAEAAEDFAQIIHATDFQGVPILYSWPTQHRALDYLGDRESALWSADKLRELVTLIADEVDNRQRSISIISHSSGATVVGEALRVIDVQEAARDREPRRHVINQIIMAAADVDRDIFFDRYAEALRQVAARTTIYVNKRDTVLRLSAVIRRPTGRPMERLGGGWTDATPFWQRSEALRNDRGQRLGRIDWADVTNLRQSLMGHDYHVRSPEVAWDMKHALQGYPPEARLLLPRDTRPYALRYWEIPGDR